MKFIYNKSGQNISCGGVELLDNFVSTIQDSIYNQITSDESFNNLVKNKQCIVFDDMDTAKSVRFYTQQIAGYVSFSNDNVTSYQDVVSNRQTINDNIAKLKEIKKIKVAKYLDIDNAIVAMNNKLAELTQIVVDRNAEFIVKAREYKAREITMDRDSIIESGIEFKGHIFQSAKADRDLLTSTISLFNIAGKVPENFVWIAKDNTPVPMTLQELIQLGTLMANSVSTHTYKARALKDSLNNLQTIAEVESVKYE